jgi:predicted lipid-binding transport protein (Tim44 family)
MHVTDIIILALVSLIICLKLFFLFGQRRDGHHNAREFGKAGASPAIKDAEVNVVKITDPLARIKVLDASFDPKDFLKSTQEFYKQVMVAYGQGDTPSLSDWLNIDMMRKFAYAITKREDAGLQCHVEVIGVQDSILENAVCDDKGVATLKVKLKSEVIKYITAAKNKIIDGSKTKIEKREDVWTFSKDLRYQGQGWRLTDVDQLA